MEKRRWNDNKLEDALSQHFQWFIVYFHKEVIIRGGGMQSTQFQFYAKVNFMKCVAFECQQEINGVDCFDVHAWSNYVDFNVPRVLINDKDVQ